MLGMTYGFIVGRMGADPECRKVNGHDCAEFSLATETNATNSADGKEPFWWDCKAWRNQAAALENYGRKGRLICVRGQFKQRRYTKTDKDGKDFKVVMVYLEVDSFEFLDSKVPGPSHPDEEPKPHNENYEGEKLQQEVAKVLTEDDFDPFASE